MEDYSIINNKCKFIAKNLQYYLNNNSVIYYKKTKEYMIYHEMTSDGEKIFKAIESFLIVSRDISNKVISSIFFDLNEKMYDNDNQFEKKHLFEDAEAQQSTLEFKLINFYTSENFDSNSEEYKNIQKRSDEQYYKIENIIETLIKSGLSKEEVYSSFFGKNFEFLMEKAPFSEEIFQKIITNFISSNTEIKNDN